jgi:haloacetate dehalogenase
VSGELFPGFKRRRIRTGGAAINLVHGGVGPPLLLLHGYPQTHAIWHRVAPELAKRFRVVAADLRGYGDSEKPHGLPDHANYSKRAMAQDQVEAMRALGHETFFVVGHDRGGRVAHRMALDHPASVEKIAVLDIVPTRKMYASVSREFAKAYYHWFFLLRPEPIPETLIGANPDFYIESHMGTRHAGLKAFAPEALAEYRRCFRDPATIHASCEDYRAAESIDLAHDETDIGRKVVAPLLVLWGRHGTVARCFSPLADWSERAESVQGRALDCGHYIPEEAPAELLGELVKFLS